MAILFYTTFSDEKIWKKEIKKQFKNTKIYSINDRKYFDKIEYAIIWNLPDKIFKKLINLKIIFSQGAGVDHILRLPSYNNTPIIRLKDPAMGERMANFALSQILNFQLNLKKYLNYQNQKIWVDDLESLTPLENNKLTIGILGTGFLGLYVGKFLKKNQYNVIGFKKNKSIKRLGFPIYYNKNINKFINLSDVIIAILPATKETKNFINKKFLSKMKNRSLLINVGRGVSINEKDLIKHLRLNKNFYVSLDVFNKEPLPKSSRFWKHPNVTITPHIASITVVKSAVKQMHDRYKQYKQKGKIISDVNLKDGY
tara:strand:- start:98 stop:1036 length:939 start_codon:yes stop_codon:yes gene_type:complete